MKITVRDVDKTNVRPIQSPLGGRGVQPVVQPKLLQKGSDPFGKPVTTVDDQNDLERAKSLLKDAMKSGAKCPCCGQYVKMYRRTINATMAKALLIFYKKTGGLDQYFHLYDIFQSEKDPTVYRGDFAKLRFWGLIEESPSEKDPKKKSMGKWKITKAGIDFVQGRSKVAKYVFVYNNVVEGFGTDMIAITDALKTPFDYRSVMGYDVTDIRGNLFDYRMQGIGTVRRDGTCMMG